MVLVYLIRKKFVSTVNSQGCLISTVHPMNTTKLMSIKLGDFIDYLQQYPEDASLHVVFAENGVCSINIDLRIVDKDGIVLNKSIPVED